MADLLMPSLRRKGFEVVVAQTQRQATSRLRSLRPDILVVDVASFGSSGYRISDAVRSKLDSVPTVLLLEQGHASAGATAEAFMTPPFTSRKLLYRVKKLAEKLVRREIRAGDLALDLDARILRKGKEISRLRPKEATLLAFFMEHSGKVLSREQLIRQVWEFSDVEDTRTLSVHVRWLRLKIEENPNRPRYLRTVRGIGYRFEAPDSESED